MTERDVLAWKTVVYLVCEVAAFALMLRWRDAPEHLVLLPAAAVIWFGAMASYLVFVKGARMSVSRLWCRIVGHRDDWYDGPCCNRCGWHCADDIERAGDGRD